MNSLENKLKGYMKLGGLLERSNILTVGLMSLK